MDIDNSLWSSDNEESDHAIHMDAPDSENTHKTPIDSEPAPTVKLTTLWLLLMY
jgi:hypothetical protein